MHNTKADVKAIQEPVFLPGNSACAHRSDQPHATNKAVGSRQPTAQRPCAATEFPQHSPAALPQDYSADNTPQPACMQSTGLLEPGNPQRSPPALPQDYYSQPTPHDQHACILATAAPSQLLPAQATQKPPAQTNIKQGAADSSRAAPGL